MEGPEVFPTRVLLLVHLSQVLGIWRGGHVAEGKAEKLHVNILKSAQTNCLTI
jgi:hypothetical protein